jgi:pyruvate/2-oxoglutarate dehydrogenase complex dihydrolipoamide dehydrogenase (E3) component
MTTAFDAIIIGAGQAGPPLARRLAAAGMNVAVIERGAFGGTCVNTGCIPTKLADAATTTRIERALPSAARWGGRNGSRSSSAGSAARWHPANPAQKPWVERDTPRQAQLL